jgi:hypothetical protein
MEIPAFILLLAVLAQIGGGFVYEGVQLGRTGRSDLDRDDASVWWVLTPAQAVARRLSSRWAQTVCFAAGVTLLLIVALAILGSLVR